MKNLFLGIVTTIFFQVSFAQNTVNLKNGTVIKGKITEQLPDSILKIVTSDGSLFVFPLSEIAKISYDEISHETPQNRFLIATPFNKTTYNGQLVNRMKWKDLKKVLQSANDQEINRTLKAMATKRAITTTGIIVGDLIMAVGLIQMLGSQGGGESAGTAGVGLIGAGAGVMLVGAIAGSGGKRLIKKMIIRHDKIQNDQPTTQLNFLPTYVNNRIVPGISITKKF